MCSTKNKTTPHVIRILQYDVTGGYNKMSASIFRCYGHRYTDKYPGLESSGFSCRIIVTGSINIFEFITQKTTSTLVSTS